MLLTKLTRFASLVLILSALGTGLPVGSAAEPQPTVNAELPPFAAKRLGSVKWQFTSPVMDLAYSADGKWFVVCDYYQVYVFDPATGKELRRFRPHNGLVRSLALAQNGHLVVTGGEQIQIRDAATGKLVRSFPGFIDSGICISADGKLVAGIGGLKRDDEREFKVPPVYNAFIWDATTGKPLPSFADGIKGVMSVALAPDGNSVAYRQGNNELVVADLDGKERYRLKAPVLDRKIMPNDPNPLQPMYALAFSPDSKTLAYGTRDGLVLVDAATGKKATRCIRTKPTHELENIFAIVFTPGGDSVISVAQYAPFGVFDVTTGKEEATFNAPTIRPAVSHDGKTLAFASEQTVGFMDLATGKMKDKPGQYGMIFRAALSPDGKTAATASADWHIRLWDTATGEVRHLIKHEPGATPDGLVFSPDCTILIANEGAGGGKLRFWDVRTGKEQTRNLAAAASGRCVALSPDGNTLAVGGDNGIVNFWDLKSGKHSTVELSGKGMVLSVGFSGDRKRLVAASGSGYRIQKDEPTVTNIDDNGVYVLDVANRKELRRFATSANSRNPELAVAISPDGKLVCGYSTGVLWVNYWDADTGKEIAGFGGIGAAASVSTVAISPDGKTLALATGGYHPSPDTVARIHLFDVKSMKEFQVLEGHLQRICNLSFSADSTTLFSASRDGTGLVWDLRKVRR